MNKTISDSQIGELEIMRGKNKRREKLVKKNNKKKN